MDDLGWMDASAQAELVRRGDVTPTELVDAAIARIETTNGELNAVITPVFDQAREAAAQLSRDAPFAGVPYLLKDLAVECAGVRFTEGSRFLRDNVSNHDQELVVRLRRAGLVIVGKTNTCEFGLQPTCEPARFGPTRNPWDPSRTPSGSSGGSAAAVAAGMVSMAHANDLGGSIRFPASACGLFGLKPTRARNPLGPEYGDVVSGMAVEHAVTRSVRDSAALLDATSGPDLGDPYPAPPEHRPFLDEVRTDPGALRIAFTRTPAGGLPAHRDCLRAIDDAMHLCESLGHHVAEADLVALDERVGAAIGTMFSGAAGWILAYWIRKLGREPEPGELEPLTEAFWDHARILSAGDYLLAMDDLRAFSRAVARFLLDYDVWAMPTLSEPPVPIGEMVSTPEDPWRSLNRSRYFVAFPAVVANVTGNPAMSVPLHWNAEGLPIGVHFLGRFGDEATLLRLASQLEQARPWSERHPPVNAVAGP